jgi:hypothetical protein
MNSILMSLFTMNYFTLAVYTDILVLAILAVADHLASE